MNALRHRRSRRERSLMLEAQRAEFLDAPLRLQLVQLWLQQLQGRSCSSEIGCLSGVPASWKEPLEQTCSILTGWREHPAYCDTADERLVSAVIETLHKANAFLEHAPEHPKRSALAECLRNYSEGQALPEPPDSILRELCETFPNATDRYEPLMQAWEELSAAKKKKKKKVDPAILKQLLLQRWTEDQARLEEEWEREQLLAILAEMRVEIERKLSAVRRIEETLGVGLRYVGGGRDLTEGYWRDDAWEQLEHFARLAEGNAAIQSLAEQLGRYENVSQEIEMIEEESTRPVQRQRWTRGGRSEIRGVYQSDDLERLTAGELAFLADPELEPLFLARYAEKRLLCYELEGRELFETLVPTKVLRPRPKKQKRGPIILCIDTSGSMQGEPELVAKTLTLAILKVALREERPCLLISFGATHDQRVLELSDLPANIPQLLQFLGGAFHGGTDVMPALDIAMQHIETTTFDKADILLISDGVFRVDRAFLNRVENARSTKPFAIHALIVGEHAEGSALGFADWWWNWSPGQPLDRGSVELIRRIHEPPDREI